MAKAGKQPIENAVDIIAKFGGIRPMASKINVAVTTVQGWKKRGVIPATRKAVILKSAEKEGIDLSEFFDDAPAVRASVADIIEDAKNKKTEAPKEGKHQNSISKTNKLEEDNGLDIPQRMQKMSENAGAGYTEIVYQHPKSKFPTTAFITTGVVVVALAVAAGSLWPKFMNAEAEKEDRLAQLESEISFIKEDTSGFKGFVSEELMAEIGALKQQANQATGYVGSAVQTFKESSAEFINESGMDGRIGQIQNYVSVMGEQSGIYGLMNRFDSMRESYNGQETLGSAMSQISQILSTSDAADDASVNNMLDLARIKNKDLSKTFESVPKDELKAAAMLLAMTQVRSSLNRKEEAFDEDLALLMNMVGKDDPVLHESLLKLAPHAKAGILTPNGLKEELKTITGDAVVASLRGEDVSFSDKISEKMNDILQVEKDGEMVANTDAQVTVKQAKAMMEQNQWEEALTFLNENLTEEELGQLDPLLEELQGLLDSSLEDILDHVTSLIDEVQLEEALSFLQASIALNENLVEEELGQLDSLFTEVEGLLNDSIDDLLAEVMSLIDGEQLDEALSLLNGSLVEELDMLQPLIDEVQALLTANDIEEILAQAINTYFSDGLLGDQ